MGKDKMKKKNTGDGFIIYFHSMSAQKKRHCQYRVGENERQDEFIYYEHVINFSCQGYMWDLH